MYRVRQFKDVDLFFDRAAHWLCRDEAEHNVLLGLVGQLRQGTDAFENPIYLATVEGQGKVVGCAFRTPPWPLGLTRLPADAIGSVVDDVGAVYRSIPAVLGPESVAREFARLWAADRACGWSIQIRQRIHVLTAVAPLGQETSGRLRLARPSDLPVVRQWFAGFFAEAGTPGVRPPQQAERLTRVGSLYLWDDSGPRSMAAAVGETAAGIRIGYVFTPTAYRSRGYATSTVAELSRRLLCKGREFCCLYTDLANPVSNAIYARIGYQPLCDVVRAQFCDVVPPGSTRRYASGGVDPTP